MWRQARRCRRACREGCWKPRCLDRISEEACIEAGLGFGVRAGERDPQPSSSSASTVAIEANQKRLETRTEVTKELVVRETLATYQRARELDMLAPARAALELLARLHGHIIERKDVMMIPKIEDLSDEEVAALAADGERHEGVRH